VDSSLTTPKDKTLKDLKAMLSGQDAPIGECLYFAFALRFQTKDHEGRLMTKLGEGVRQSMEASGSTVARAKAILLKHKAETPRDWPVSVNPLHREPLHGSLLRLSQPGSCLFTIELLPFSILCALLAVSILDRSNSIVDD